jgi:hypothetical protein
MMKDLKVQATTAEHADIGWSAYGDRMVYNAEAGRAVVNLEGGPDDTLHENVMTSMFMAINAERNRLWDTYIAEDVEIPIKKP